MSGINKAIIVGRLGNEPEMRTMPNGEVVALLSVATSEQWTDKNSGEKREQTEWHRIVFYRRQAEVCGQYLHKGSLIYVEGRLHTRKWQDLDGVDRYTTEILGSTMQMLDSRHTGSTKSNTSDNTSDNAGNSPSLEPAEAPSAPFNDEIPFAPIHHGFSKHSIAAI